MTRVEVSASKLRQLIREHNPTWLDRARAQTKALEAGTPEPEFRALWSDIKDVYIRLQGGDHGGKCAYCEKWLEATPIEHDVEHFRPKAAIARWNIPDHLLAEFQAGGLRVNQPAQGNEPGYRLLAYHLLNYAAACKQCNSVLKRNLFPITGKRRSDARDPGRLKSEGALLIYPIGHIDDDPETLIEFRGISPRPKARGGFDRLRAMATIEVFELDDWRERKSLIRDRVEWIEKLFCALRQRDRGGPPEDVNTARKAIARLTSTTFRHANCLRSFLRLYESNPDEARAILADALEYLASYSPSSKSSSRRASRTVRGEGSRRGR